MAVPETLAKGVDFKGEYARRYDATKKPQDFAVQQITQGIAVDPVVDIVHNDIQLVDIRGAYHYERTTIEWKRQADNFLEQYERLGYHFVGWDYEKNRNTLTKKTDDECLLAMQYVSAATGDPVFLYCGLVELNDMVRRGATWVLSDNVLLWLARYFERSYYYEKAKSPAEKPPGSTPTNPYGYIDKRVLEKAKNCHIWQFAGGSAVYVDGNFQWADAGYKVGRDYGVQQDNIDLNAYMRGGVPELRKLLKLATPAPEPDPPPIELPTNEPSLEEKINVLWNNAKKNPPKGWEL